LRAKQQGSANPPQDNPAQGLATSGPRSPGSTPPSDSAPNGSPPTAAPVADDGKIHVVEPGETLWSIARGILGPDANNAEIAHEVDRLWRLNADRIGTGTPDLIRPGQRLRLG
jgi:LysM repeat protein